LYYNTSGGVVKSLRRLGFGLSTELWIVEVGIFLNINADRVVMPMSMSRCPRFAANSVARSA
jgi:hypothetical protein